MKLEDPTQVGRFVIQRRLGAGAMGVVLVGRDDTLDREVAVKLVKPGVKPGKKAEGAKLRLLREAQAMAKLAHPNVVAIYEAGLHEDGVYIAMELVYGQALDGWLKQKPRTVLEILERFLQAGRGLAAAHAKGIIHRDFKPANVLVGEDGRTRVGDFGLARAAAGSSESSDDDAGRVVARRPSAAGNRADAPAITSRPSSRTKARCSERRRTCRSKRFAARRRRRAINGASPSRCIARSTASRRFKATACSASSRRSRTGRCRRRPRIRRSRRGSSRRCFEGARA